MNGNRWGQLAAAFLGALIVLAIWVLNTVGQHRDLAQDGRIQDERTIALVERRYTELGGRLDKHSQRLDDQKEAIDLLVQEYLKLNDLSHTHLNAPKQGPSGRL